MIDARRHKNIRAIRAAIVIVLAAGLFYSFAIMRYNAAADLARDLNLSLGNLEQSMQARYEYIESIFNKIRPTERGDEIYTQIVMTRRAMFAPARNLEERISDANAAERAVWSLHEYIRSEPRTSDMAPYAGLLVAERGVLNAAMEFSKVYERYRLFRGSSFMSGLSLRLVGASDDLGEFAGPLLFVPQKR